MIFSYSTPLTKDDESSLMWYFKIHVPDEYVQQLNKPDKRVLCSINGDDYFHCALTSNGQGSFHVIVNKERRKKLKIEVGDEVQVKIQKDKSKYGMPVTESFTALCEQDPEGDKLFHSLTMGKQRSLLNLMCKPKSETKQLEKVLIIFDYLKSVNGALDFKELNEAFKNNRFKL